MLGSGTFRSLTALYQDSEPNLHSVALSSFDLVGILLALVN